jgi:hypothetical protein
MIDDPIDIGKHVVRNITWNVNVKFILLNIYLLIMSNGPHNIFAHSDDDNDDYATGI